MPQSTLIGRVLDGKVRIDSLLGEGGMGAVYRGIQLAFNREVAIKLLKPQFLDSEDLVLRFYREAKSAGQLRSRHVVTIYDYGRVSEGAYIVMELSSGVSLADLLDREGRVTAERAVSITAQVLSGLAEAHERGIVHRDLKTDNILIEKDYSGRDFALLLDFGIARMEGSSSVQTAFGSVFGTPSYMAPEQCRGEVADARTDLYSMGVILYEMLAGVTPFGNRQPHQLLVAHMKEPPPHISIARPDISDELARQVMKMIAKTRDERHPNADVCRKQLLSSLAAMAAAQSAKQAEDAKTSAELSSFEETVHEGILVPTPMPMPVSRQVSRPLVQPGAALAPSFDSDLTLPPEAVVYAKQEAIEIVANVLTETLGPVAAIIVHKEISRMLNAGERLKADQIHSLIERVCLRIKDAGKRDVFARDVREALISSGLYRA